MGSNCVSAPKCRCRPAKKKRPLCCSDSATSTPVPTGKQNNFTAVWSKLFTCVIITFLLCLLNYMGNVSHKSFVPQVRRFFESIHYVHFPSRRWADAAE